MQAVLKPSWARPKAARRPAPPAPPTLVPERRTEVWKERWDFEPIRLNILILCGKDMLASVNISWSNRKLAQVAVPLLLR